MLPDFGFNLNDKVKMVESDEQGVVLGRAQYTDSVNSYYIRYKAANGRQVKEWHNETDIVAVG